MKLTDIQELISKQVYKYIPYSFCCNNGLSTKKAIVPILSDYGKETYPNYKLFSIPDANYKPDDPCCSLIINPDWFNIMARMINAWLIAPESIITKHSMLKTLGVFFDLTQIPDFVNDEDRFNILPFLEVIEDHKEEIFQHIKSKDSIEIDLNQDQGPMRISLRTPPPATNRQMRNNTISLYGASITIRREWEVTYTIDQLYLNNEEVNELEMVLRENGISNTVDNHIADLVSTIVNDNGFDYLENNAGDLSMEDEELTDISITDVVVDIDEEIYEQLEIDEDEY